MTLYAPKIPPDAPIEYSMFWELWQRERFFECHETLEELWKRTMTRERWFYAGLINASVAIYQHRRGNSYGACRQLLRAQVKLLPFAPSFQGVETEILLQFVANEIAPSLDAKSAAQRAQEPALRRQIRERMARDFPNPFSALDDLGDPNGR